MANGFYNHVVYSVNTPFTKTMKEFVKAVDTDSEEVAVNEKVSTSESLEENTDSSASPQEILATGNVAWSTYYEYFASGTNGFVLLIFICGMILGQSLSVTTDYWLSRWAVQSLSTQTSQGPQNAYVYVSLTASVFVISMARATLFFMLAIAASKVTFIKMLSAVLRSPLHFFQTTPIGQSMK